MNQLCAINKSLTNCIFILSCPYNFIVENKYFFFIKKNLPLAVFFDYVSRFLEHMRQSRTNGEISRYLSVLHQSLYEWHQIPAPIISPLHILAHLPSFSPLYQTLRIWLGTHFSQPNPEMGPLQAEF